MKPFEKQAACLEGKPMDVLCAHILPTFDDDL